MWKKILVVAVPIALFTSAAVYFIASLTEPTPAPAESSATSLAKPEMPGLVERPETFRVERSIIIASNPAAVLAAVSDLRTWSTWSPWEVAGTDVTRVYAGPSAGRGSTYYWATDSVRGRVLVMESAFAHVAVELVIDEPKPYQSDFRFMVAREASGTRLTWRMTGDDDEPRAALFPSGHADRDVGPLLAQGLANLKRNLEASSSRYVLR